MSLTDSRELRHYRRDGNWRGQRVSWRWARCYRWLQQRPEERRDESPTAIQTRHNRVTNEAAVTPNSEWWDKAKGPPRPNTYPNAGQVRLFVAGAGVEALVTDAFSPSVFSSPVLTRCER